MRLPTHALSSAPFTADVCSCSCRLSWSLVAPMRRPCTTLSLSTHSADMRSYSCLQAPLVIHAPHALPMYRDDQHKRKRKSERDRDDAAKFRKPQAGQSAAQLGRGAGGNIGATGGTLLTQYVLKSQVSLCCLIMVGWRHAAVWQFWGCVQGAACFVRSQTVSMLLAPTSVQHCPAVLCGRGCVGPAHILVIQDALKSQPSCLH